MLVYHLEFYWLSRDTVRKLAVLCFQSNIFPITKVVIQTGLTLKQIIVNNGVWWS